MRTTIDIPDALFREIKSAAALRGESLKGFLLKAVRAELETDSDSPKVRASLPIVKSREASYDLNPDRLAEIQEEEDHAIVAGH